MSVPLGTVVCPVCGETNDPPVKPEEPTKYGRCQHCAIRVPVGTGLCDVCGERNEPPVREETPPEEMTCPHCGMTIGKASAESTHTCPVCGENPFPKDTARDAIDHLPGDVPQPPAQPLAPAAQAIVDTALAGIATQCVKVGTNYTLTDSRVDDDGEQRVSFSVAIGPDGKPLPPIPKRTGQPGATSILVVEATATKTHTRIVEVATNRIRYSKTGATIGDALEGAIKDSAFLQPWNAARPKGRRRLAAVVVGAVVIAGVGAVLLLGGGGDEDDVVTGPVATDAAPETTEATIPVGTRSTNQLDVRGAPLPTNGIVWVATKRTEVLPPPEPIQPLPIGHKFRGTFTITETCTDDDCVFTTPMDIGAGIAVVPVPEVPWDEQAGRWFLDSVSDVQSSNTGGLVCALHRQMSWGFTAEEVMWDGSQWVVSRLAGTMSYAVAFEQNLSAAAIAKGYCPPYQEASEWDAVADVDTADLP